MERLFIVAVTYNNICLIDKQNKLYFCFTSLASLLTSFLLQHHTEVLFLIELPAHSIIDTMCCFMLLE